MGEIWFASDYHFGHRNIIRHADRPFKNVEQMDETLIKNWNDVVGKSDRMYFLGDFSFYPCPRTKEIAGSLNGQKYLVKGNHDTPRNCQALLDAGWIWVKDIYDLKVNDKYIALCHYPIREWNRRFHKSWHCHGHIHNREWVCEPGTYNVSAEVNDYAPVHYDVIKYSIEKTGWGL